MAKKIYFTPGPAALYPTFEQHLKQALDEQIPSISHRSNHFREIYQDTFENLKHLFDLPNEYAILFTSSATEIWERLLMNCVDSESLHLVNGAFSKKFYEYALDLKKPAIKYDVPFGEGFHKNDIEINYKTDHIAVTHNETSSGVSIPLETIHDLKKGRNNRLVSVDIVSSAPCVSLDFTKIDSAYFSVQKGFGMPAGLGVWLVNEKCLLKAEMIESKGMVTGTYHRLREMWKKFEEFQTPETPNVLGIYLLGKIAGDMLKKGLEKIQKETEEKAAMLYRFFDQHAQFEPFVKNPAFRSKTVIVVNTQVSSGEIIQKLNSKNLVVGSGYQEYKSKQIRIANFPATSLEETECLLKSLKEMV